MEIIFFIIIELVGLLPVGLYFLVGKENIEEELHQRFRKYAVRSIICDVLVALLFIFWPSFRIKCIVLSILLQIVNGLFFRKVKR